MASLGIGNMENPVDSFKAELKALLEKYKAKIAFECSDSSDTYGIYSPELVVKINRETHELTHGFYLESSDL